MTENAMNKVRVLIVDDSFFMRKALAKILTDAGVDVIDTAKDGREGYEKAIQLKPDLVTMDIEMPQMTGIESLKKIMDKSPMPVLMVSTLTSEGAEATMEALANGAVDFISKPKSFNNAEDIGTDLVQKVIEIGNNSDLKNMMIRKRLLNKMQNKASLENNFPAKPIFNINTERKHKIYNTIPKERPQSSEIQAVGIGISTGGPVALRQIIPQLPENYPVPIFITQHMPKHFTKTLAERLNKESNIKVVEAESGKVPEPGTVYIAPGGLQLLINSRGKIEISKLPEEAHYKPSVDVMMDSLVKKYGKGIVGVMMTGMGSDGLNAFIELSKQGGYIVSQDINSCVVAGMSRSVINAKIANEIKVLEDIPDTICSLVGVHAIK